MQEENNNGLARPSDFQRTIAEEYESKPERVLLPRLGKEVLLKRPSPQWFIFRGLLPQSIAARASNQEPMGLPPGEVQKIMEVRDTIVSLLKETMLDPRVSINPGPDEISPEMISSQDLTFIVRWAYGELRTEAGGSTASLDQFRK